MSLYQEKYWFYTDINMPLLGLCLLDSDQWKR